jgi:hypothetical protein
MLDRIMCDTLMRSETQYRLEMFKVTTNQTTDRVTTRVV